MSLPDILPTGALASGAYVDYMLDYLDGACDSVTDELDTYWGKSTLEGWNTQWTKTKNDIDLDVTDLNTAIATIKAQIRMVDDALNRL